MDEDVAVRVRDRLDATPQPRPHRARHASGRRHGSALGGVDQELRVRARRERAAENGPVGGHDPIRGAVGHLRDGTALLHLDRDRRRERARDRGRRDPRVPFQAALHRARVEPEHVRTAADAGQPDDPGGAWVRRARDLDPARGEQRRPRDPPPRDDQRERRERHERPALGGTGSVRSATEDAPRALGLSVPRDGLRRTHRQDAPPAPGGSRTAPAPGPAPARPT